MLKHQSKTFNEGKVKPQKDMQALMKELEAEFGSDDDFLSDLNSDGSPIEQRQSKIEKLESKLPQKNSEKEVEKSESPQQVNQSNSVVANPMTTKMHWKIMSTGYNLQKIINPDREIQKLQKELRLKESEIERLNLTKQYTENTQLSSFHLAFMFASPLVRKVNKNLENIMQLDYQNELVGIEKTLKNVKHELNYRVEVATINNFRSIVADAPFALHFTGHGIENNRQSLGSSYKLYKDKGNILLLEDENLMADYLFEGDLKKLVEISRANRSFTFNYEVVFVSSCHSEFAGDIFLASGAHHVICIQKSATISDKASLRFSKVFYEALFIQKYSVCEAYKIAKEDVRTLYNNSEASKYILMVNNKLQATGKGKKNSHKCFPITEFKEGSLRKEGTVPFFDIVPSRDEGFKGRQKAICEVLALLNKNRLVNILGPPGIGKTALSRNLINLLRDRKRFTD